MRKQPASRADAFSLRHLAHAPSARFRRASLPTRIGVELFRTVFRFYRVVIAFLRTKAQVTLPRLAGLICKFKIRYEKARPPLWNRAPQYEKARRRDRTMRSAATEWTKAAPASGHAAPTPTSRQPWALSSPRKTPGQRRTPPVSNAATASATRTSEAMRHPADTPRETRRRRRRFPGNGRP